MRQGESRARVAKRALAGMIGALAALALPAGAAAHEQLSPAQAQAVVGSDAQPLPNGMYQVQAGTARLQTHGPDLKSEMADASLAPGDPERAPACTTDVNSYHQHILYAYNQGATNRLATTTPHIQAAVRRMNFVLDRDSVGSGGPHADYRVLCTAGGAIRVDAFPVGNAASGHRSSFDNIVTWARNAGFTRTNVDYSIFYDANDASGLACGVGSLWFDDRAIAGNLNNNPGGGTQGGYAVTYGPYVSSTNAGCWYGTTPMHENGHNSGAVQRFAPFSTGTGAHCWDEIDVMCYSPDGGDTHQEGTVTFCPSREFFDCRYDTYFDSAPEAGEWLATHWNLGSTLNRFIKFGGAAVNQPPVPGMKAACTGRTCAFRDLSTDPDGTIASRLWNFGDGTTATAINPSRTYATDGSRPVTLKVTDDDGAQRSIVRYVAVAATGVPALLNNRLTIDSSKGLNAFKHFRIGVPTGQTRLQVALTGPAGADLDLYVRRGGQPTTSAYHCAPFESDSTETCTFNAPAGGQYYIGIHNYDAPAGTAFTIKATITP